MLVFKKMLLLLESATLEEKLVSFHRMEPQRKMTLSPMLQKLSQEFAGQQREAHLWSSAEEECPITGRHWGFVLPLGLLGTKPTPHSGICLGFAHMYSSGSPARVH